MRCKCCGSEKPSSEYYASNHATCRVCVKLRAAKYYYANKEHCLQKFKNWISENPERSVEIKRAYRERNREAEREYHRNRRKERPDAVYAANKKYKDANPDVYTAAAAKRRASILKATPLWANLEKIALFYKLAAELSIKVGEPHEVDHIIPLQGRTVNGLHVETNLRVIPRSVNRSKSNKMEKE